MMKNQPISQILIEPGTLADLDAILRIEQASFSSPWTRKMFEGELTENPFGRLLVARQVGEGPDSGDPAVRELVGYVCFWVVFEELRLMTLAVDPAARRQGIGAELLRRALAVGRAEGARRALLEVRASNAAALRLYERAGFRQFSVREKYYTNPVEDAVLMELHPLPDPV